MSDGQPLLPGALVFYGTSAYIRHLGLYIGGEMMIDAPDFGQVVKIQPYRYSGDDYSGGLRTRLNRIYCRAPFLMTLSHLRWPLSGSWATGIGQA
ncbi:hypothetical protein GCM10010174_38890 [Kutzneria viridogrisea]|uniref:NlpC/P60 family protein n=1 Tax=Kutzneria viridogrisea TaxID=47990 RepID=UPI00160303AD